MKQAKKEIEEAAEKAEIPGQMNLPEDPEEWEQEEAEEEQEEEWQQAHPESITSLCYSCQRYSECNVKTGTCQIKSAAEENEEMVQLIIANAYRDKTIVDMLEEEKRLKESLQYMKDNGLTLQGYKLDSGRLRDVIASIMNTTGTKIAQIESINKHLIPEFSAELKEGRLTFSAAYEISGMAEDKQMELLEKYKEGGLSLKEVKQARAVS